MTCAFLQSGGIDAILDHHETCSNVWIWGDAVGVDLRVPRTQAEDAAAALVEVRNGVFAIPDVEAIPRHWVTRTKSAFMLWWMLDFTLLVGCALIALLSLAAPMKGRGGAAVGGRTTQ